MKKGNKILIIAIIILLTTACVKKEKEQPTYYLGQEYKDYVVYKVGSYWIYQDSTTRIIDSIYLYKQNISILKGKKTDFDSESLDENRYSSLYDTLLCGGGIIDIGAGAMYREARLNDYINSNINYFEGNTGDHAPNSYTPIYIKKNDTLIFNNKIFFNVEIFENKQQEYSYQPTKTYYAKHVGLIRKELFNGQVWNLIRYKVSQ